MKTGIDQRQCTSRSVLQGLAYSCVKDYSYCILHSSFYNFTLLDNTCGPKHKIQLIPTPWCDGPSITNIPIPTTCHNILPGNCDICGIQDPCMYMHDQLSH